MGHPIGKSHAWALNVVKHHDLASELRNGKNNRLDVRKISALFGLSLDELAVELGRSLPWVCEHPDAASLQSKLEVYERIANALMHLVGTEEGLRIWLNMESEDLGGATPMTLIKEGDGEVVATLLEDALLGQPG